MVDQKIVKLTKPSRLHKVSIPAVLTIAGSDSSGGAGIEADLKTITAHQVYGLTCITALTAQNTQSVQSIVKTSKEQLQKTLESNFDDFIYGYDSSPLKAIKTGMLTKDSILVLEENKKSDYKEPKIESLEDFTNFVIDLQKALECENVLVKGGHIPWNKKTNKPFKGNINEEQEDLTVIDILYQHTTDSITIYESEFLFTKDTHGTGCTLSSSIASNVAKGLTLDQALPLSINYIHRGILSLEKKLGHGNGPLNHTVTPEVGVLAIIKPTVPAVTGHKTFFEFFKEHPKVKENWRKYTEHEFLHQLAENKLPFNRFLYFLKQDFYYLVNYAQVHALAASVAPNYQQTHSEALIIGEVVNEIEKHKSKLQKKYNIDYDKVDLDIELQPGKACLDYCDFLLEMGRKEDFLGIKVALAPCLHGYAESGINTLKYREDHKNSGNDFLNAVSVEESNIYDSWIADYTSDWYREAHVNGIDALETLLSGVLITTERLDELVEIFNKVTMLECNFWSEVVAPN
ncbi:hypothetical protein QCA50_009232 [Cerrena zonata]|uniref:Phosphomethylpyrimidine kinase n=1 Tax=Cerrena zonata TaxID=2478898 RepID=A0AAW0G4Q5_9APHY